MVQDEQLCAMDLKGFWMDVGQPKDYIKGVALYLKSLADVTRKPFKIDNCLTRNANIIGNCHFIIKLKRHLKYKC